MSESYFNETQKLVNFNTPKWTAKDAYRMHEILYAKGYLVNCVSRVGCDREIHDAWLVDRDDVPQLVEELFRQRLVAEFQAEGKGDASIIFCYDYAASTILHAITKFRCNRLNGGVL